MERSAVVHHHSTSLGAQDEWPEILTADERWVAAQRVVNSGQFSRSPLLSRFLLYIVAETIQGHEGRITEHQIGVRVFDRPATYRTIEDNIVRNYARQLRKRLANYYACDGVNETVRIEIPLGGYVPVFHSEPRLKPEPVPMIAAAAPLAETVTVAAPRRLLPAPARRTIGIIVALLLYTAVVAGTTWFIQGKLGQPAWQSSPTDPLWSALLDGPLNTYIVPSDAGFNLLNDVSHKTMALADYMNGAYNSVPLPSLDAHSARDLHSQQFTSFVALKAIVAIGQLREFRPGHDVVRFPRNLHLQDLQNANVILFGSEDSNPWTSIAQKDAPFRILDRHGTRGAEIVVMHPRAGEQHRYVSHWNDPEHETFALIQYLRNLDGTGHILIVQGLDVAGTQAAAEELLHPKAIASILRRAMQPNGQLRPFEILLRTTSIASNAEGTQIIASRVY